MEKYKFLKTTEENLLPPFISKWRADFCICRRHSNTPFAKKLKAEYASGVLFTALRMSDGGRGGIKRYEHPKTLESLGMNEDIAIHPGTAWSGIRRETWNLNNSKRTNQSIVEPVKGEWEGRGWEVTTTTNRTWSLHHGKVMNRTHQRRALKSPILTVFGQHEKRFSYQ